MFSTEIEGKRQVLHGILFGAEERKEKKNRFSLNGEHAIESFHEDVSAGNLGDKMRLVSSLFYFFLVLLIELLAFLKFTWTKKDRTL